MTNEFNPDWDTQAVLVEEIQRMAKRIEELEAKDEPVAWFWFDERDGGEWIHIADNQINADKFGNAKVIPLYTTPPQRKPLTDEQIFNVISSTTAGDMPYSYRIARAIEAAHGIKGEA